MDNRISPKSACRVFVALSFLAAVLPGAGLLAQDKGISGVVTVPVRGKPKVVYEESYALIVGINDYPYGSAFRALSFAVDDAEAMRDLLVKVYGFPQDKVTLLTDKTKPRATKKAIMDGLLRLSKVRNRNARVVFYFSGHGHTVDVWQGKAGYLVPAEAPLSRKEATYVGLLEEKCIPMSEVRRRLAICRARHRLILLDSCFGGLAISGKSGLRREVPDYLQKVAFSPVLKLFVAGRVGEQSYEKPEWGHGAFTGRLLEALRPNDAGLVIADDNGDGYITTDELWGKIPNRVRQMTRGKQNPKDAQEGDGEMLFVPMRTRPSPPGRKVPDTSQLQERLKRLEEERRRAEQERSRKLVEAAKKAYTLAQRIDVMAGAPAREKADAWADYIRDFGAAGYNVAHARRRLAHWRNYKPPVPITSDKTLSLGLGGGVTMKLVLIPSGEFMMGSNKGGSSEKPVHRVKITKPFYMGLHEVTNAQYRRFKPSHDSGKYKGHSLDDDRQPVVRVSWNDATAFCGWLGRQTGRKVRLPTEAQWEYACRAGSDTVHPWGNQISAAHCNYADRNTSFSWRDKTADDGHAVTAPVGSYQPNGFGLYDMIGNVWEWCADWYDKDYYKSSPTDDPTGPRSGKSRVLRGGSWSNAPVGGRSAGRDRNRPGSADNNDGFRVAASARP